MSDEKTDLSQEITEKKHSWREIVKEIITFAIIAFGIVLPFRAYVAEPYLVDGRSMDPTFSTGDYLIVDKLSYKFKEPERNSVLVFKYPQDTNKNFIKRIIGLPGETVRISNGVITIINAENPEGFVINEPYIVHPSLDSYEKILAGDEYYVLGDNRAESFDSRYWGPLQKKYMLGKPVVQLFPVKKISILPGSIDK